MAKPSTVRSRSTSANGSAGPFAYSKEDERRNKPSWLSLGGYFETKGRGKRKALGSSQSQQKGIKENRGTRNNGNATV